MSDAKLPPLPWSSTALRQPWSDSAADPYRIRDADGQLVLRRNWKDVCLAIAHMVRSANEIGALRRDFAAASATIAAQSLALATMREAMQEYVTGWDLYFTTSGDDIPTRKMDSARRQMRAILAEPADTTAALAGAVLEAADHVAHWLHEYRGVIQVNAMRNGNDFEVDLVDEALDAYRRARSDLRGGGAVEE